MPDTFRYRQKQAHTYTDTYGIFDLNLFECRLIGTNLLELINRSRYRSLYVNAYMST